MVSVIIPTFDRGDIIKRAIQSVLNQQKDSFELIIVDDGSTDNTARMIEEIQSVHKTVRCIHQANHGPSSARNVGIRNARGPFIAFLDSDDEWFPHKLRVQLDFFNHHPDYLVCQTEEIWIRNAKRVNPMKKHQKYGGFIFEKSLPLSIVSPSCVMMRKEFFDRFGLFDESLLACEDYDLWLRASARTAFGFIKEPYVRRYGGHEDQQSRKFSVMDQLRISSIQKLIKAGGLNQDQEVSARMELIRKCEIVYVGAIKRKNVEMMKFCEEAAKEAGGDLAASCVR
jgi:glycosyltransferase involved in cell wall biosynthesis